MTAVAARDSRVDRWLTLQLTAACFTTAATINLHMPLLGQLGKEFHVGAAQVGRIPMFALTGFLLGVLLLVPLGDRYDKRKLILAKVLALTIGVFAISAAPSLRVIYAGAFGVGVCASLSQDIIPLLAAIVEPSRRGQVVGTVMSGIFLGVLFARLGGGIVAARLGWRWVYLFSAATLLPTILVLYLRLPASVPVTRDRYVALIGSLVKVTRGSSALRRAALTQFLLSVAYGGFWATLSPMLLQAHQLGSTAAGLIGLPGAAGVLVSSPAGRWADRVGSKPVVLSGILLVASAFGVLLLGTKTILAVAFGAAVLDCGFRAQMVANQAMINAVDPSARSRFNTVFAAQIYGGGACGAFLASSALAHFGWVAACAIALTASAFAALVQLLARRETPRETPARSEPPQTVERVAPLDARARALAGIAATRFGQRIEASVGSDVLANLETRSFTAGEIIVNQGEPVPGLVVVGVGEIELFHGADALARIRLGELLFGAELLRGARAPATARAGASGAIVLFAGRKAAHELFLTSPLLLEVFSELAHE